MFYKCLFLLQVYNPRERNAQCCSKLHDNEVHVNATRKLREKEQDAKTYEGYGKPVVDIKNKCTGTRLAKEQNLSFMIQNNTGEVLL